MARASSASSVDRIESPTEDEFRRRYVERSRPVVITDPARRLPQMAWDFDYLTRTIGDSVIPVYDWGERGPTIDDEFVITYMKAAEAIRHARAVTHPAGQRFSVCQLPIEQIGDLQDRYQTPPWLEHVDDLDRLPAMFREPRRRALFISFFRGIHWHNGRDAVAQLLSGRKRFVLFAPGDSPYLYPRRLREAGLGWFDETEAVFCSEIPFEQGMDRIDRARFPLLDRATPLYVDLEAGESLYIPSHWWHFTTAVEPCVVVVEFWDAPLGRWGYPIAWRSLMMKPYRKYLYRHLLRLKKFSRNQQVLGR